MSKARRRCQTLPSRPPHRWRGLLSALTIWMAFAASSAWAIDNKKPPKTRPKMWLVVPGWLTPPKTTINLTSIQGHESFNRVFSYSLTLAVKGRPLRMDKFLGRKLTAVLTRPNSKPRYVNGHVTEMSITAVASSPGDAATYNISLSAWPMLLRNNADMQLYQNMTVPQIMAAIFKKYPFARARFSLKKKYPVSKFYAQYRETDLNFISRMLEHVGIATYYEHRRGAHTLVLTDHLPPAGRVAKGQIFSCTDVHNPRRWFQNWTAQFKFQPTRYTLKDYNFLHPGAKNMQASARIKSPLPYSLEVYDYPGEFTNSRDARFYTDIRLQELRAAYFTASASNDSLDLSTGDLLAVRDCPLPGSRAAAGVQRVLVSSAGLTVSQDLSTPGNYSYSVRSQFSAVPASAPYRPSRTTPKPVINGIQTAVVVGPRGKTIHTDKHGRIKVRFHWIRPGHNKLTSSAWLRVVYPVAHGSAPRGFAVPKIGQEVVVSFMEGDPDRPLVTGIVYKREPTSDPAWPASATELVRP